MTIISAIPSAITPEKFIKNFRSFNNELMKGKHIPLHVGDRIFYAVPRDYLDNNITMLASKDIATPESNTGRNTHRITLNPAQLKKMILDAGEYEAAGICEFGENCTYFLNQEQYHRLNIRKERQAQKEVNRTNGHHTGSDENIHIVDKSEAVNDEAEISNGYLITQALSHWDNLKADHRNEGFVESVTLYRGRIVGILMRAQTAEKLELDTSMALSNKEIEWATKFKKNYAGLNSLKEEAGLVPYHSEILFYAPLGHVMANAKKFQPAIEPDLWNRMEKIYHEAERMLVAEYWRKTNPLSLGDFHAKRGSVVGAVNCITDRHFDNSLKHLELGKPIALLHATALKGIIFSGEITGTSIKKEETDVVGFPAVWKETKSNFDSDLAIIIHTKGKSASLVGPQLANDIIFEKLKVLSPSYAEMLSALNVTLTKPKEFAVEVADQSVDRIDSENTDVRTDTPDVVEEPVTALDTPASDHPPLNTSANMKNLLEQVKIVSNALNSLRAGELSIEHSFDDYQMLGISAQKVGSLPDGDFAAMAEIYNTLGDESETHVIFEVAAFEGNVTQKIKVLQDSFTKAERGITVLLRADGQTLMVSANQPFMAFVKDYTI